MYNNRKFSIIKLLFSTKSKIILIYYKYSLVIYGKEKNY